MKSHTNSTHIPRDYLWKVAPYHSGGFGRIFLATHPSAKRSHIVMKVVKIPARKTEIWPLRMEVEALQRIQKCTKIANHIVEQPSAGGLGEENCIWWSRKDATLTMLFTYYPATLAHISMIYMDISGPLYIKNVICDIVHGLVYLHDLGIIHKDIKPDNIFLDNDGICKIGDLGAAFVCSDPKALQKSTIRTNDPGVRSYDYCAPELVIPLTGPNAIDKHGKHQWCFDERVDFWALGMMVYELVVGTVLRWCECRLDEVWDTIFVPPSEVLENMMDTLRLKARNCDPDIMRFVQRACQHYYPSRLNGKEAIAIVSKWESCSDPFKNRFEISSSAKNARDSEDDINSWLPIDPGKRHPLETKQIERTSSRFQRHLNKVDVYIPENSYYRYVEVVRSQFFSRPK